MRSFPWDSIIIGKNEEYGYPIIDRPSSAEDLRELYKTFFSNGVFLNEENAFQVTPGDGMNVIVAGGKCGIEGTVGYEAAPRGLAIQASSTTDDRIDTVVLRWNNNAEVRNIDLYVKTGFAQSVPVRPTLTRSESVWELGISDIFVAKNSGAISTARITDTRLQTDRCGAVTPFMQIDTTTFFNQLQAQTQEAVDLAQSAIDGTLAGNLQSQIDDIWESVYPVGALYLSFEPTSPAELFGGSWIQIAGAFLRAASDTTTGGSDTVTLTTAQMPSHNHTLLYRLTSNSPSVHIGFYGNAGTSAVDYTGSTGSSKPFNVMPSYQNIYVWRRIED